MAPVKKPRPAFSCLICRTRKVRCGRERPECANCRRMNKVCKYESTSKVSDNQNRQDQSDTDRSSVSRLDVVSRLPSRVRPVDDSFLGLTPFRKKATVDPLPSYINFLTIASVLERIPDKHACDGFVQTFITSVYPLYPLIDLPGFQSWYAVFWQWCHEAGDRRSTVIPNALLEDVTMNCVLFAVLYAGAAASAHTSHESAITKILETAVSTTLIACDHLRRPTVNTVAASLIIDPFVSKDLGSLEYGLWLGSTVRLAHSIGLHRQEHATLDRDIDLGSVPEARLERRIWAHIVWLDVQHSLLTGLPLAVTATAGSRFGSLPTPMVGAGPDTLAGDSAILFQTRSEMARIQYRFINTVHNASASTGLVSEEIYQGNYYKQRGRFLASEVGDVGSPAHGNSNPHSLLTIPVTANTLRSRYRGRSRPRPVVESYNPSLHPIPPNLHINHIVSRICATSLVLRALCGTDSVFFSVGIILVALAWLYRCIFWNE
ncbi:uncharacterized protein BDW70DRAFT_152295 [Aspergillus foveolatus]|uniref:uncharacterized protein n=1 Tax=Aspergillus foveolatus TaxID=210207 RepID=UPI003CCE14F5